MKYLMIRSTWLRMCVCVCVCRTDETLRWTLLNSAVRLMIVEDVSIRVTCEIVHLMLVSAVVSAKTR